MVGVVTFEGKRTGTCESAVREDTKEGVTEVAEWTVDDNL